jgi:fucose 4-O-acetylase-like acetyltransferase
MVEICATLVIPKIKKPLWGFVTAGFFLGFGLYLTQNIDQAENLFGIYKNTWYIHEALVGFGFYALGYYSFPILKTVLQWKGLWRFCVLLLFSGMAWATFNLNAPYPKFVVIMKESWHGNPGWFLITAFSGSLSLLLLSTFFPPNKALDFIGRNTLILLGMNGFFHLFINLHIATRIENLESIWAITITSLLASILSILASVPVILFLNKYLPQLVGRPYQKGPWWPGFKSGR